MELQSIVVGPFAVNCYLFWDQTTMDGVIIDPGAEAENIISAVTRAGVSPRAVLLTHGHGDHIAGVADVKKHYAIPLYVGRGEEELLANPSANVSAFFDDPIVAPPADVLLDDEQMIRLGSVHLRVLATPGHSPAGVCYLHERDGVLFCGDTLFAGSIGRTDFPGCSLEMLLESIQRKIMPLPENVLCFPGHGPRTTVGAEKNGNPFLRGSNFV
jgi:glyoxylase-like metal-dependent hydrolase (beta-lactamase superfamily II)